MNIKKIGHTQNCKSCRKGKVTFYIFQGLAPDSRPTEKEKKLKGAIIGSCNHCGMCCGEKQK